MPSTVMTVGVVIARRRLKGPWQDHAWLPHAVLSAPPEVAPFTPLGSVGDDERFYLGPAELEFHSVETAQYRDNLAAEPPRLWVALRESLGNDPVELVTVTADPAEGEALTEPGTAIVECVPMPADIAEELARFVAEHHVERPFHKRKRDRTNPEAMAGRPHGGPSRSEADE
jgi:hypothetical protein